MSDSRFLEAASLGSRIVQQGFDEYWRNKQFQEMLSERSDGRQLRQSQAEMETQRFGLEKQKAADEAAYRTKSLDRQKARDLVEENHWRAIEGIARQRADKIGVMKPGEATSALGEIDRIYSRKDAPPMDSSTWHRRESLKQIQQPGYTTKSFPGVPPSGHLWWYNSGEPAEKESSGDSSLPGLE